MIDDWYDDGRVDGTYPLHCYDDAIEILPRDVRDYSSAKEDIQRALQAQLRGDELRRRRRPIRLAGTNPTTTPHDDDDDHADRRPTPGDPTDETIAEAAGAGRQRQRRAPVPVPLLVLGGLALLLVAGGSAGYLVRRHPGAAAPPPAV